MSDRSPLRLLPAVERVLNLPPILSITAKHGRTAVTDWVREVLAVLRDGQGDALPPDASRVEKLVVEQVTERASVRSSQRLRKVINATGIVLHTNLGRAPLAGAAVQALQDAAECSNVEVDLASGERGRRGAAIEVLLEELTGAEAALVVNTVRPRRC